MRLWSPSGEPLCRPAPLRGTFTCDKDEVDFIDDDAVNEDRPDNNWWNERESDGDGEFSADDSGDRNGSDGSC